MIVDRNLHRADYQNPYYLLTMLLTPLRDDGEAQGEFQEYLRAMLDTGHFSWSRLVDMAHGHCCLSLFYVRLSQENLLGLVPVEQGEVLKKRFRHNLVRNLLFRVELAKLLKRLGRAGIEVLLLKGAASWMDNLYGMDGAREMSDIDILARTGDIDRAAAIIEAFGYRQIPDPNMVMEDLPTDQRHHHLQTYHKPGSPVVLELHYRLGYARIGGMVAEEELWKNSLAGMVEGVEVRCLNPTYRLIHNTAHGMVPECEFIRSKISLRQLAEFVFLAVRYQQKIEWQVWFAKGVHGGMATEFLTWLSLAHKLFGLDYPPAVPVTRRAKLHAARILLASRLDSEYGYAKGLPIRLLIRLYYYLKLPGWVWENVCYTEGGGHVMARMKYIVKKAASPRSRAKIG